MAAESARAVSLYREDFPSPAGDGTLASVGWDGTNIGVSGHSAGLFGDATDGFHWWFSNTAIAAATTTTEMSFTTEMAPIDSTTPALTVAWEQRLERQFDDAFGDASGTGTPVDVRVALRVGGQWYASANAISSGNTVSATWTPQSLAFNPAAANWLVLSDVDATPGVTLGAAAGSNLSGTITGAGFVSSFKQRQTINFNFMEISGVPEPASLGLAACAAIGLAAIRRKRAA
jgi:hypothetical protein